MCAMLLSLKYILFLFILILFDYNKIYENRLPRRCVLVQEGLIVTRFIRFFAGWCVEDIRRPLWDLVLCRQSEKKSGLGFWVDNWFLGRKKKVTKKRTQIILFWNAFKHGFIWLFVMLSYMSLILTPSLKFKDFVEKSIFLWKHAHKSSAWKFFTKNFISWAVFNIGFNC